MRVPALLLIAAPLTTPLAAQAPTVDPGTAAILTEMETLVRPCVQPTKSKRVFFRCIDTHSSIHAHWAAYRIARAVPQLRQIAVDSETALEYHKLRHEVENYVDYLYARAWFLRLATEYEKWALENNRPDPHRMRPVADQVARALIVHYRDNSRDPLHNDYNSTSWAMAQLHQYLLWTGQGRERALVDSWIDQVFMVDIAGTSFKLDLNSQRFFSTFGNWHHVVHTTRDKAAIDAFWQLQDPIPDDHLVVNSIGAAHSYGLGWSRVWALRDMAASAPTQYDRDRFHRSALEHVGIGMQRHFPVKDDFLNYGHWVPQFAVYAVTEGSGF
jgi:hypothetical protein